MLRELAEHIGTASNNVAEYRGLIAGLKAVRELDPDATVEARLDSKLVVEQMSGRWKIKHPDMRRARAARPRHVAAGRRSPTPGCRASRTSTPTGWPTRRSTPPPAGRRGRRPTARPSCAGAGRGRGAGRRSPAGPQARLVGWDAELGTPTTTVLLRHGETPHTAEKRFSGSGGHGPGAVRGGPASGGCGGRATRGHRRRRRGRRLADAADPADGRRGRRPLSARRCARSTRSASARSASGRG